MRRGIMLWTWDHGPNWLHHIAARVCCLLWGHEACKDHCGMPEHDYCTWCLKPMPGKAARGIDAKIEAWHRGAGYGLELHEYLGMTWEEYQAWAGPRSTR